MSLQGLFGPGVTVVEGSVGDFQGPLLGVERDRAQRMAPGRRAQFTAGRHLARTVLGRIGADAGVLPIGVQGAPVWPDDVVGAITHCGDGLSGRVAVAVASKSTHIALGLDVEADAPLEPAVRAMIIDEVENRVLADDPTLSDMLFFSIKETIYKAVFPLSRRFLDFHDVRIDIDRETMGFVGRILPGDWPSSLPDSVSGRYRMSDGFIATGAEVRRNQD